MKVLIVIERCEAWRGGAETSTLQFAGELSRQGHDVHIVTASQVQLSSGLTVHSLPSRVPTRGLGTLAFIRKADRLARETQFDIVHAITPVPSADIYQPRGGTIGETIRRNAAMRRNAWSRFMYNFNYSTNIRQQVLIRIEKQMLSGDSPAFVAAVSEYGARQIREDYHLPDKFVHVVFNAVHLTDTDQATRERNRNEIRKMYHITDDSIVALFVAHNFRLKGLPRLLEAWKLLHDRQPDHPFRLLVVGRDNPVPYRTLAENLGILPTVSFVGPTERTLAFYHAADVCVHPTYYDPCSRVVMEAMAEGLACITTRQNGACELITHEQNGYIIDSPEHVQQLTDCLSLCADVGSLRQMARQAAGVREFVDISRHVRQINELYQQAYRRRRSNAT